MTDLAAFLLGTLALLATPGPTNTLLAASGASLGVRGSLRLIPAELAGYLIAIGLLVTVAGPMIATTPWLATGLKLLAGLYLVWSAAGLWRAARLRGVAGPVPPATPKRVFVTTLLNPKGLVFALVLFPGTDPVWTGPAFALSVMSVALCWILIGRAVARLGRTAVTPARVSRMTAVVLSVFALVLAGSALGLP